MQPSDNFEPEPGTGAPSHDPHAVSISLADVLTTPERFGSVLPFDLFDALVEGDVAAFVRLPTSFDCTLSIPARFWRSIDQASFVAAFGARPYGADRTYRIPTSVVASAIVDCLDRAIIVPFNDRSAETYSLLYYLETPNPFDQNDEASPPPSHVMSDQVRADLVRGVQQFVRRKGYVPFLLSDEAIAWFARSDALSEPGVTGRRGAKPKAAWEVMWREMVFTLLASPNMSRTQLATTVFVEVSQKRGVPNCPSIATIVKELSSPRRPS